MVPETKSHSNALPLMLTVIALSCAAFYGLAASHIARATFFYLPICLALLQMLLHHLGQRQGWPRTLAAAEDLCCIAAVLCFILIGITTISPIIRNATQARLERMVF